jgi:hypothetical protein
VSLGSLLGEPRHFRCRRTEHERGLIAQNGQLLRRDLGERLAQPLGVIETDAGQHRDPRRDHVRGIEPSAESRLDHPDLDPRPGEGDESGCCRDLELRHLLPFFQRPVDRLRRRGDASHGGRECLGGDLLPPQLHSLRPAR